jgi:hypothetical protein
MFEKMYLNSLLMSKAIKQQQSSYWVFKKKNVICIYFFLCVTPDENVLLKAPSSITFLRQNTYLSRIVIHKTKTNEFRSENKDKK